MTADIHFMIAMRKIDSANLIPRDILILWAVRESPGLMGRELAIKLGYKSRSNVQFSLPRLIRNGLIEDRRIMRNNLTPNDLHILPKGEEFLNSLVRLAGMKP